jgi:hypothetical protein
MDSLEMNVRFWWQSHDKERRRLVDKKMDVREIEWGGLNWTDLAQDSCCE